MTKNIVILNFYLMLCFYNISQCQKINDDKMKVSMNAKYEEIVQALKCDQIVDYVHVNYKPKQLSSTINLPPKEYTDVINISKNAVPYLLKLINSKSDPIRIVAYWALRDITNKRFGGNEDYYLNDSLNIATRKDLIEKWNDWWGKNKNKEMGEWFIEDLSCSDSVTAKTAIILLGKQKYIEAVPSLRNCLKNDYLKFYATETLASYCDFYSIPYLIDLYLTHENAGYRKKGIKYLMSITGKSFNFKYNDDIKKRDENITKWKQWWKSYGKKLIE